MSDLWTNIEDSISRLRRIERMLLETRAKDNGGLTPYEAELYLLTFMGVDIKDFKEAMLIRQASSGDPKFSLEELAEMLKANALLNFWQDKAGK